MDLIVRCCLKQKIDIPYSLHDMFVSKITYKNESVHLIFSHGYVSTEEPYTQVDGKIAVENVDMDYSCVLLLSKMGKYGNFSGTKISLNDFIAKYNECFFEIVDEMYGYNQVEYIGYLHFPNKNYAIQMSLSIYFNGDIVYETEEA